MTVYVGETTGPATDRKLAPLGWGRLWSFRIPTPPVGEPIALDNGAFRAWKNGTEWDGHRFERYIERVHATGITPDFCALPDIVGSADETLCRSWHWIDRFPNGWPLYLVLQDGMEPGDALDHFVPLLAGVFLGGTDAFKPRARDWCEWAHHRGLKFHYGRCVQGRLRTAHAIGADSIDTTQLMWSKNLWRNYVCLHRSLIEQPNLFNQETPNA